MINFQLFLETAEGEMLSGESDKINVIGGKTSPVSSMSSLENRSPTSTPYENISGGSGGEEHSTKKQKITLGEKLKNELRKSSLQLNRQSVNNLERVLSVKSDDNGASSTTKSECVGDDDEDGDIGDEDSIGDGMEDENIWLSGYSKFTATTTKSG